MPVPTRGSRCACEGASSEAETRSREEGTLERGGARSRGREPSSEADPLEGGVSPRARRDLLEGAFDWATLVGRGGHRSVGRAVRACLGKSCFSFCFLQVLSRIPPVS
jgi:hypothetical protein